MAVAWPGATFISIGDYRDQANAMSAIVVFDFNGNRVRVEYDPLCCHRCNMRAIYLTLEALRLSYKRGLADVLMHTVAQMLALPGAQYIDPYELLGVRPDADLEDIEAMYRIKAKRAHPDKGGTAEQMAQLNAAIERIRADRAVPA
jgi:hypothetical protein